MAKKQPHQLLVHVDQHPTGDIEIQYDYPFSEPHHLREQVLRLPAAQVSEQLRNDFSAVRDFLRSRIEIKPVRVPHGELLPTLQDAILTVVTRDKRRNLPFARLFCVEAVPALDSRAERKSTAEGNEFPSDLREAWTRIKQKINGTAWDDFQKKVGIASK
jgi:hypothetical protein